jgi:uncharacterized membrane-anchored protein YitT (DUF2179 family)
MKENEGGTVYHHLKGALLIIVGIFLAGFGLKGFLLTNQFIDGWVRKIVNDVDEKAFIYCFPISQAKGGVLKKRPLHH